MKDEITQVKGIGPSTATLLAAHGIETIRDLAAARVVQLAAIRGFTEIRAAQVISNAQALLQKLGSDEAADGTRTAETAAAVEQDQPSGRGKPDKKKKKDKKSKEKDQSKKKDKNKKKKKGAKKDKK